MPIQDPLTQQIIGLWIEVRRLGMDPGKGSGEMELEVKDIQ